MLKIAICDDEQPIRDYLKSLTEKCVDSRVSIYASGEELLRHQTEFEVILLDISLHQDTETEQLNGMEVARKLRKSSDAIIIFITALKEYVFDGYDVGAFHYLLKPINEQKFREVMEKAVKQIAKTKEAEPLIIKVDGNYIKISVNQIIYAENNARKIILHTKEINYSFYEKMEVLENKLGNSFFRSHRGYLVNLQAIARYDNANIELKNGEKIFLSKQKYHEFVTAYMDFLRKA